MDCFNMFMKERRLKLKKCLPLNNCITVDQIFVTFVLLTVLKTYIKIQVPCSGISRVWQVGHTTERF
jgi:hypothetical protein